MSGDLRIGVIGFHTKASWAKESDTFVITALAGITLAAIATRSDDSVRRRRRSAVPHTRSAIRWR